MGGKKVSFFANFNVIFRKTKLKIPSNPKWIIWKKAKSKMVTSKDSKNRSWNLLTPWLLRPQLSVSRYKFGSPKHSLHISQFRIINFMLAKTLFRYMLIIIFGRRILIRMLCASGNGTKKNLFLDSQLRTNWMYLELRRVRKNLEHPIS